MSEEKVVQEITTEVVVKTTVQWLNTDADLSETSYRWAAEMLMSIGDTPSIVYGGSCVVTDGHLINIPVPVVAVQRPAWGNRQENTQKMRSLMDVEGWMLVGRKGNVVFSMGA